MLLQHLIQDDMNMKFGEKMTSRIFTILLVGIYYLSTTISAGIPTFFPFSGSKTIALNGIYLAGNDGISSLSSNPAGLSQLNGRAIEVSIFGKLGQQEFSNNNGSIFKSFRDDDVSISIGSFWRIMDNLTIAIDYNNSIQYRVNWPFAKYIQGDSLSAVLAFDHSNDFLISSINPSVAYNFGNISVGISLNVINIKHKMGFYQGDPNWEAREAGIAAYQVNYNSDAWAFGGAFGIQANVMKDLRIGAFMKSSIIASLKGEAESNLLAFVDSTSSQSSLTSEFSLPWTIGFGLIYNINKNLKINADALYNLWSSTNSSQEYLFGNSLWNNRLSNTDSLSGYTGNNFQLNYKNSFDIGLGLEYFASKEITLRFGYRYSQSQLSETTYNMLYPSVDQHWFSMGVGFWFEELYMDLAIAYAASVEKSIPQKVNLFYSGSYKGNAFIPSVNIKYQF